MRALFALGWVVVTSLPALADGAVAIVVPNRSDVPIIINGVDASWSVIEGDWGLARSVHVQPTVYGGRYVDPEPHVGRYFPSAGKTPGYGRLEIEEPARRPRRAESYSRSWSAQSAPPRAVDPPVLPDPLYGAAPDAGQAPRRRYD
jgi:hypothetical protein